MLRDIWWKLGAILFSLVAPTCVVAAAVLWAKGTGPYEWKVSPHLMRGGLAGFIVVAGIAAAFLWRRRKALTGLEAGFLWLGLGLAFTFAFAFVSNHLHLVSAAIGYGFYLWGGLVYGFAVAVSSGLALAYLWNFGPNPRRGGSARRRRR